jgi:hypothetical protein
MHKSQKMLVDEITLASKLVKVGENYRHYKQPDNLYKVLNLAITEADDSLCVIYQACYGEELIFVRPLESWLETVKWNGKLVKRFSLVN